MASSCELGSVEGKSKYLKGPRVRRPAAGGTRGSVVIETVYDAMKQISSTCSEDLRTDDSSYGFFLEAHMFSVQRDESFSLHECLFSAEGFKEKGR